MKTRVHRVCRAVDVAAVGKAFGNGSRVVDEITFTVETGTCFGLLGSNGAGKSTILKMVNGFYRPSAGTVRVFERDVSQHPREVRRRVGVAPQEDTLDPDLDVQQNLWFSGRYRGLPGTRVRAEASRLLTEVGLAERTRSSVLELSAGMRRRLVLARALLGAPPVIVLDEPTRGLDREGRAWFLRRFQALKAAGTTLLLATHDLEEARILCDRVAVLEAGRMVELADVASVLGDDECRGFFPRAAG